MYFYQCQIICGFIILIFVDDFVSCSACDTCQGGFFDFNQCRSDESSWCIDVIEPLRNDAPEEITTKQDRIFFKLETSQNVFSEDLLELKTVDSNVQVQSNWQNFSVKMNRDSGLTMMINLLHVNLNPVFEDVTHTGDNDIVLKSTDGSSMYHWKKPLIHILTNHCRYPIPRYYYITANEYPNRYTRAMKIICANQNFPHSQFYCPPEYFDGQLYHFRTVNDRCHSNKASKLQFEKNSFYCTQNTELLTKVFKFNIREKLSTSQKSVCDIYHRKCETCLKNEEKNCQKETKFDRSCCASKCHRNLNCFAFYMVDCYDSIFQRDHLAQNICMKGDTIKFTLTPKFDFENNSFLCHIRRKRDDIPSMTVTSNLQLFHHDQLIWSSNTNSQTIKTDTLQGEISLGPVIFKWNVPVNVVDDMYLHGRQEEGSKMFTYKLSRMKEPKDLERKELKLFKHTDSRYLQVQNGRPFYFSTENWYNNSCRLKIADLYPPQNIYEPIFQQVFLENVHKSAKHGSKNSFVYTIESAEKPNHINIKLLNKSIIPIFLCGKQSGKFLSPTNESGKPFIRLKSVKWPRKWNIYFEGAVSKLPTYVNIKIIDIKSKSVLFYEDQIVHKSYFNTDQYIRPQLNSHNDNRFYFSNNFTFQSRVPSTETFSGLAVKVEIKDCYRKYSFKLFHFKTVHSVTSWRNSTVNIYSSSNMNFLIIASKITVLTLALGSIYFALICLYFLKQIYKFMRINSNVDINNSMRRKRYLKQNPDITFRRKCMMLCYVAFRVFYTFLFTLSVGFSLFLGIDSNNGELHANNNRFFNWVRQESRQINQFTVSELRRHLQYSVNLKKACENQDDYKIKRLESEMSLALNTSLQHWYSFNSKSILNETVDFFNKAIDKYEERLRQISEKLQFNIESRFLDRYGQYQQLLKQYYYLTYLVVIQTVHNSSNPYHFVTNSDKVNVTFVQRILVDFFNFISIYEPMALNFNALQNLNKLKSDFHSFIRNKNNWNGDFQLLNTKITKYENSKTVNRMFFTKYMKYRKYKPISKNTDQTTFDKKNFKNIVSFKIIQTRMFLVIIDCFIVIYRFYNTFEVLKWMWLGKKSFVYSAMSRDMRQQIFSEVYKGDLDSRMSMPPSHRSSSNTTNNISLRFITNHQYPDWLPGNHYQPTFNCFNNLRRYLKPLSQMHVVTVFVILALLMLLLTVAMIANYLYHKHYNSDSLRQNLIILERLQPLINDRLGNIVNYVNNHILDNAKIHNINMSNLIINSSYLLSHIQKTVCQQLTWEMNSIRERSNTHSIVSFDICRLQSDVNFLPYLLVHISPCQFLNVLPINYTLSAIFHDKTIQRSSSVRKVHQIIFMLICLVIVTASAIGSIHMLGNVILKYLLKSPSNSNCRFVMLTPLYPHTSSYKVHSSSSHSTQSGRNIPIIESNCLIQNSLATVAGSHFIEYPSSMLHYQLTATSESDV